MKVLSLSSIIVCLLWTISTTRASQLTPDERNKIDELLTSDFSSPPFQYTGNRTDVDVFLYLSGIRVITSEERRAEYEIYLYQLWHDPRLRYNASLGTDFHVVRPRYWDNLWLGETYLEGMVASRVQDSTMPNKFVWVFPNGTLAVANRLAVAIICNMDVFHFPMAEYDCLLKFRVHSYPENDIKLRWSTDALTIADDFDSGDLKLLDTSYSECVHSGNEVMNSSCLQIQVRVEKSFSNSILRAYIPSIFIIFVGWLSFWIDRGEVSARVKLGTLCVLAMITDQVGMNFSAPDHVTMTSIEVWYTVCLFFVTCVIVEFTVVHAIDTYKERLEEIAKKKKERQQKEKLKKKNAELANGGIESKNSESSNSVESKGSLDIFLGEIAEDEEELSEDFPCMCLFLASLSPGKIEKWSRIVYILAFLLFQLIYWLIFLNAVEVM